jgi:hypothetical protein
MEKGVKKVNLKILNTLNMLKADNLWNLLRILAI